MVNFTTLVKRILLVFTIFILATNFSQAQDTDGDSYADSIDNDDDNDGILDSQECSTNITLVLAGNPTTINSGSISSTTALANSDVIEVSNVGTLSDGTNLTAES